MTPRVCGSPEEDDNRIADELVDRSAVRDRDARHLGQVLVEQRGQFLGLQALAGRREAHHVGEKDGQLLALGGNHHVLLAAEDGVVVLRREIFGELVRDRREELVGTSELAIEAPDHRGLVPLQADEGETDRGHQHEIAEQPLERKNVRRDRLPDDEFLDAGHVAHFPIALRALRVRVVAVDAGGVHDDGRDEPYAAVEDRAGDVVDAGGRSLPQGRERLAFKLVEGVGRAVLERIVRKEAEADIVVAFADHAAELEGERGGDGNAAGHIEIVGNDMGRAAVGQQRGRVGLMGVNLAAPRLSSSANGSGRRPAR
jgi:hypothetical protein